MPSSRSTILHSSVTLSCEVFGFRDVLFYDSESLSAGVGVVHVREVP